MAEISRRRMAFLALQVVVLGEGVVLVALAGLEFLAAQGGDPTILAISGILVLLGAGFLYLAFSLRSRASTPFFATVVGALFSLLVLVSFASNVVLRGIAIGLDAGTFIALVVLSKQFHLRPGEFVKEEKLPPEVIAKISTRVQGTRCRECGDDDVWLTTDKALVCKNCGTLEA